MSFSKCIICNTLCNENSYQLCDDCKKSVLQMARFHSASNKDQVYKCFLKDKHDQISNYLLHPNYSIQFHYSQQLININCQKKYALFLAESNNITAPPTEWMISSIKSFVKLGEETLRQAIQQNERKKQTEYVNEITEKISNEFTDYRTQFPLTYRCSDGHFVRSKAEREIDNFLFSHDITHVYEYHYLSPNEKEYFPDFYIPKYNLIIEYFGLNKENYLKTKSEKIETYSEDKRYNFEYLTSDHDSDLEFYLTKIFKKYQY